MKTWQLQEAKARMSELVKHAQRQPQTITVHGKPVAVLLSQENYDKLTQSKENFVDFMRRSPLYALEDLELERDTSPCREVEL